VFGKWGAFAYGGANVTRLQLRYRIISTASLVIYAIQATVYSEVAGLIGLPLAVSSLSWVSWVLWVFVGFFALGAIMNGISRSKPERYTWTPLLVVSLVFSLVVALNSEGRPANTKLYSEELSYLSATFRAMSLGALT
jgi:hypothetical protein